MNSKKIAEQEFVEPIKSIVKKSFVKHYKKVNEKDVKRADKIILSGTPLQDNEYLKNLDKFEWIKNCEKPLLGICAGMQVIAKSFGSNLKKNREIGMTKIKVIKKSKLFSNNFEAYELHNYAAEKPKSFEILAKSNCIQAMKHKKKEIYCVLFHPEVRNKKIIENFLDG